MFNSNLTNHMLVLYYYESNPDKYFMDCWKESYNCKTNSNRVSFSLNRRSSFVWIHREDYPKERIFKIPIYNPETQEIDTKVLFIIPSPGNYITIDEFWDVERKCIKLDHFDTLDCPDFEKYFKSVRLRTFWRKLTNLEDVDITYIFGRPDPRKLTPAQKLMVVARPIGRFYAEPEVGYLEYREDKRHSYDSLTNYDVINFRNECNPSHRFIPQSRELSLDQILTVKYFNDRYQERDKELEEIRKYGDIISYKDEIDLGG